MNKLIGIIVAVILIVGGVYIVKKNDRGSEDVNMPTPSINATSSNATSTDLIGGMSTSTKVYTMTEVSSHADAKSCWSAISSNVYDLTAWIPKHPGGPEKILGICGKDGTSAFMGKHGKNEKIVAGLSNFFIGKLQ